MSLTAAAVTNMASCGCVARAVTQIQRFGSALNLNIHYQMLFLDGGYVVLPDGSARFRWVKAPSNQQLTQLAHTIAHRVGRFLERQGLPERDTENSYLAGDAVDDDALNQLLGHTIIYCIAVGPQAGRKVFTLQTLPACDPEDHFGDTVRTRNVSGLGCELSMDEQESKGNGHTNETLGWIAIEQGSGTTDDGRLVQVLQGQATDGRTPIVYPQTTRRRYPAVLADVMSTDESDPVFIRYSHPSTTSPVPRALYREGHRYQITMAIWRDGSCGYSTRRSG